METLKEIKIKSSRKYNKLRKEGMIGNSNNYNWGVNYLLDLNLKLDTEYDRLLIQFHYKDSAVSIPVVLRSNPSNPKARVNVYRKFFKEFNAIKKDDLTIKRRRNKELMNLVRIEEGKIKEIAREREMARQKVYFENKHIMSQLVGESSVVRGFQIDGFGTWNCDQRQRMADPVAMPKHFANEDGNRLARTLENKNIYIIDLDKNGVISFSENQEAFYDRGSKRMAILVFISAVSVGIYQSWHKFKEGVELNNEEVPLRQLDISKMTTENFIRFVEM